MKVLILEEKRDLHFRIYGIDGEQRTEEFFKAVFGEKMSCIYPTTDAEREEYHSEAKYTLTCRAAYDKLCEYVTELQETLDLIADAIINGDEKEEYEFEYAQYIV